MNQEEIDESGFKLFVILQFAEEYALHDLREGTQTA
jgi:hypothetical protein